MSLGKGLVQGMRGVVVLDQARHGIQVVALDKLGGCFLGVGHISPSGQGTITLLLLPDRGSRGLIRGLGRLRGGLRESCWVGRGQRLATPLVFLDGR